jgi:hypothetical protein
MEEMGLSKRQKVGFALVWRFAEKALGLVHGFSEREVNWLFGAPKGVHGSS